MTLGGHFISFLFCLSVADRCSAAQAQSNTVLVPEDTVIAEIAKWASANAAGAPRVSVLLHTRRLVDPSQCELNRLFPITSGLDREGAPSGVEADLDRVAAAVKQDADFDRFRFFRSDTVTSAQASLTVFIGKTCHASLPVTRRTPWHLVPDWLGEIDLPLAHQGDLPEWLLQSAIEKSLPVLFIGDEGADKVYTAAYGFLGDMKAHRHSCSRDHSHMHASAESNGLCDPLKLDESVPLCRRQYLIVHPSAENGTQLLDYAAEEAYFLRGQQNVTAWLEDYFYSRLTPDASVVIEGGAADPHEPSSDIFQILFVALLTSLPHYILPNFSLASAASVLMLAADFNCDHVLVTWQQGDTNALENFNDAKVSDPARLFSASDDKLYRACNAHGCWSMMKTLTQGEFMNRSFFKKLGAFNHNYKGASLNGSAVVVLESDDKATDGARVLYSVVNSESLDSGAVIKSLGGTEEQSSNASKMAEEAVDNDESIEDVGKCDPAPIKSVSQPFGLGQETGSKRTPANLSSADPFTKKTVRNVDFEPSAGLSLPDL
ncbi:WD repeat domain 90 [Perkinsus chesapeaki]|uniref:WD repeat domain 90 n=1 Tax=Perkinsus chesapeaki TaxID=330153 RepID=A0A7J6LWA7_PERCH|nr:WD repeat domain 90 [Perkinsus chesapeaki]